MKSSIQLAFEKLNELIEKPGERFTSPVDLVMFAFSDTGIPGNGLDGVKKGKDHVFQSVDLESLGALRVVSHEMLTEFGVHALVAYSLMQMPVERWHPKWFQDLHTANSALTIVPEEIWKIGRFVLSGEALAHKQNFMSRLAETEHTESQEDVSEWGIW